MHKNILQHIYNIIANYNHLTPLDIYLACVFRKNKKYGARDRKIIKAAVYSYFKICNGFGTTIPTEKNIELALWALATNCSEDITVKDSTTSIDERLSDLEKLTQFDYDKIFPFKSLLSPLIETKLFIKNMLLQQGVFIRVNKGKVNEITKKLRDSNISSVIMDETCVKVKQGYKLKMCPEELKLDFELQDYASQLICKKILPNKTELWWDACAGSGGKSLALVNMEPSLRLMVSDNRKSILHNLKKRFLKHKISGYQAHLLDLTQASNYFDRLEFIDGILLDIPCSGSGTWARSPEQLSKFTEAQLPKIIHKQRSIINNSLPYLKPYKRLIYMTCSAFRVENEDMVEYMQNNLRLKLVKQGYVKGYKYAANTMFFASLIKT